MAGPTFSRPSEARPLFYLELVQPAGLTDYAVGYLPNSDKPLTGILTLAQTWQIGGLYLFLGTRVVDEQRLVADALVYMEQQRTGFLWISNPADPQKDWQASKIVIDPSGVVTQRATIAFRNYTLLIEPGNRFGLSSLSDGLVLFNTQEAFWQRVPPGYQLKIAGNIDLPFIGDAAGALKCVILSAYQPADGISDFAKLDAALYYFFQEAGGAAQPLSALCYPVLRGAMNTLAATLDPVNPLVKTRSLLRFMLTSNSHPGGPFEAGFVTVYGTRLSLTPVTVLPTHPAGPSLVFTVCPTSMETRQSDPFYLAFDGPFLLNFTGTEESVRMLCGFSGVEYARFINAPKNILTFFAGQPAFAPIFRQETPVMRETALLTDQATTSWLALTSIAGTDIQYFAQPEGAAFYAFASNLAGALNYLEVLAGTFPSTSATVVTSFPAVPYALAQANELETTRAFELRVLSPARRDRLTKVLLPTGSVGPDPQTVLTTTPQGLLLQADKNLRHWQKLTLARQQKGTQLLQVTNVIGGMKAALQTNQLFAVITNQVEFARCCQPLAPFGLTVDGWGFDFSPANWQEYKTILLFKYASRSIEELAQDTAAWSWLAAAKGWNDQEGSVEMTQLELRALIKEAKEQTSGELAEFYRRVLHNPDWNGVLFLRIPVSSFPANIQALLVGLVGSALYAHHFVIDSTPIQVNNGVIQPQDSALSAFVDYADAEDLYYDNLDYAYKVLALKVSLMNSRVVNITSQVELMINTLFGDMASLEESVRSNNLVLNGYLQGEGQDAVFVFNEEGSHVFRLQNSVLSRVEVTRVQFLTLEPDESNPNRVATVFILGGNLEFEELPAFDIFSYGRLEGTGETVSRLQFANLIIHMDFTSDQPTNLDFRFDAGSMAFDLSKSMARPASLVQHFPLKLMALVQGPLENGPGELGYIEVRSPLTQSAMTHPWYGLAFELDLGTLGALAGDVGFTVTLLAAWRPAQKERLVFVGMKLPGLMSTRPEIPLEGVLKLSFGSIEFTVNHEQGSAYLLRFRNMALKVLGFAFPPGQTDVFLFGDPTGSGIGTLGWYAAYAQNEKPKKLDRRQLRQRLIPQGEVKHG